MAFPHYEYRVRPGDTLSGIIYATYGWTSHNQPVTYRETLRGLLAMNPHIADPDRIRVGDMLRLPDSPNSVTLRNSAKTILHGQGFVSDLPDSEREQVIALARLAENTGWLTIPGSIAAGTASNLLSHGDRQLLEDIGDLYAEYKSGRISKSRYQAQRVAKIAEFRRNIGPFEKLFFPRKGAVTAMRGNRWLLPSTLSQIQMTHLRRLAGFAKNGGIVLTGLGVTAACAQIAHTVDQKEKNQIFLESVASAAVGSFAGGLLSLFLISSPVGWGAALVLAIGSTGSGWLAGKGTVRLHDTYRNKIDFVNGLGIDKVCRK